MSLKWQFFHLISSDSPFKGCQLRSTEELLKEVDDDECKKHPKYFLKVDYFQNVRYYKENIRYCKKLFTITKKIFGTIKKMFGIMKKMLVLRRKCSVLRLENVW